MQTTFRIAALAMTFAFVAGLSLSTTTVVKPTPGTPGTSSTQSFPQCDPNRGCGIYR